MGLRGYRSAAEAQGEEGGVGGGVGVGVGVGVGIGVGIGVGVETRHSVPHAKALGRIRWVGLRLDLDARHA